MKKTITTITLAMVLTFGSTFANAGILVSDRSGILVSDRNGSTKTDCTKEGILVSDRSGILVSDRYSAVVAAVIRALEGIIVGDKSKGSPCTTKDGILVSDREGIIFGG